MTSSAQDDSGHYWGCFGFTFYSGRKWRCVVHLFSQYDYDSHVTWFDWFGCYSGLATVNCFKGKERNGVLRFHNHRKPKKKKNYINHITLVIKSFFESKGGPWLFGGNLHTLCIERNSTAYEHKDDDILLLSAKSNCMVRHLLITCHIFTCLYASVLPTRTLTCSCI